MANNNGESKEKEAGTNSQKHKEEFRERGDTYHRHHPITGNNTESLIDKSHQADSNQELKERRANTNWEFKEDISNNNWKCKKGIAARCRRHIQNLISKTLLKKFNPKHKKKLEDTTNQLSKTQWGTGNTYHGHHLRTGNNTESLIDKAHQAGSNQELKEEKTDTNWEFKEEIATKKSSPKYKKYDKQDKPHQAGNNQKPKEKMADNNGESKEKEAGTNSQKHKKEFRETGDTYHRHHPTTDINNNNWKCKKGIVARKSSPKHKKKLEDTTNQLSKTQWGTGNTYHGHHLRTGNNTESITNKPHLAFPSPTSKKQLIRIRKQAQKLAAWVVPAAADTE